MNTVEVSPSIALKNLLFATDFSPCSNAALPYAVAVAHRCSANLFAAHVVSAESYLFVGPEVWRALQMDEQQAPPPVDAAALEEHLRGARHEVLTPEGDVSNVLFRLVRDHNIDLLVLGTHGRTGLQKLLMGSVAESIFRLAPCPVLTVGPHVRDGEHAPDLRHVLFATDFSEESLRASRYAVSLAQCHRARLSVIHVLQDPATGTVNLESNEDFLLARLREAVPPEPSLQFQPGYVVSFGLVAEQILGFAADHNADLIVLGVRAAYPGRGTGPLLGNTTAQQIVAHASCPVLTVRG